MFRHEIYALRGLGIIDISELMKALPYGDEGAGIGHIELGPLLTTASGHEYDAARLARLREGGPGLYHPLICIGEKDGTDWCVDLIDGWHRAKVRYEAGEKRALTWFFTTKTVRRFTRPLTDYAGEDVDDIRRFVDVDSFRQSA